MNSFFGWIGGKRALRNEILKRFPSDGVNRYIEVFGGAGWVLFAKPHTPKQKEVFNDADGQLVNLYRCVKYHAQSVSDELAYLPSSRELFEDMKAQAAMRGLTDIQRAARFLYRLKISFGSNAKNFATAPKSVESVRQYLSQVQTRLHDVIVEHVDFERLIHIYDATDALFYCDPPYVGTEVYYNVSFDEADHRRLAHLLKTIKGRFVLSYNDHPLVRELYSWATIEQVSRPNTLAGNSKNNTPYQEVIITNY